MNAISRILGLMSFQVSWLKLNLHMVEDEGKSSNKNMNVTLEFHIRMKSVYSENGATLLCEIKLVALYCASCHVTPNAHEITEWRLKRCQRNHNTQRKHSVQLTKQYPIHLQKKGEIRTKEKTNLDEELRFLISVFQKCCPRDTTDSSSGRLK